ncbi:MAG: CDP-alcohol phosphatidyltransferase family protein [Gammaproteobacteria bacterium]|nr:CDP-alcohol phosphatidyltransferase family protein [Gammaproteobacteria bacterium]
MRDDSHHIYNLPNAVSFLRVLLVPVLFYLAINQQPYWFFGAVLFSEFTDVLDGYLARKLNQMTIVGSHLDSWGDFLIYVSMAACAWILWPALVAEYWLYIGLIVLSFTLPVIVGLIKYQSLTSYHTWSVKTAVAVTVVGYLLLFSGILDWPIKLAAAVCIYAAAEEIVITLISEKERVNVRSVWHVIGWF